MLIAQRGKMFGHVNPRDLHCQSCFSRVIALRCYGYCEIIQLVPCSVVRTWRFFMSTLGVMCCTSFMNKTKIRFLKQRNGYIDDDDDDDDDDNNNNIIIIIITSAGKLVIDDRSTSFLFQRISVFVQRFNAVLLNDSFVLEHHLD